MDIQIECPCGAMLSISDSSEMGAEFVLSLWWRWHHDHRATIDEIQAKMWMIHGRPYVARSIDDEI